MQVSKVPSHMIDQRIKDLEQYPQPGVKNVRVIPHVKVSFAEIFRVCDQVPFKIHELLQSNNVYFYPDQSLASAYVNTADYLQQIIKFVANNMGLDKRITLSISYFTGDFIGGYVTKTNTPFIAIDDEYDEEIYSFNATFGFKDSEIKCIYPEKPNVGWQYGQTRFSFL